MTDNKLELEALAKIAFVSMLNKALNCPEGMGSKLERFGQLLYNNVQLKSV